MSWKSLMLAALSAAMTLTVATSATGQEQRRDWRWLLKQGPIATPMQVAPDIANRDEVKEANARAGEHVTPGSCWTSEVWFLIDAEGVNRHVRTLTSSGDRGVDELALTVAKVFRFRPAQSGGRPIPVWVSIPVRIGGPDCPR